MKRETQAVQTRYARTSDDVYLGYQVAGEGSIDLVWQPDWPGNIDLEWEFRLVRGYLDALSQFGRLIRHDHRGVGLSSRNVPIPNLETRVTDLLVVLDAVGAEHPVLVGWGSSGAVNALLAGSRPDLVAAVVWMDATPRTSWAPDYRWGRTPAELDEEVDHLQSWGTEDYSRVFAEELAQAGVSIPDEDAVAFAKASRNACTPDVAIELTRMWAETDVRSVLPTIRVPSLFLCQPGLGDPEQTRDAALRVPGAEFVQIEGVPFSREATDAAMDAIRRFVGAARPVVDLDTVLATILFTDIVRSTEHMSSLGDRRWKDVLERHGAVVREALGRWQGTEVDTAGDGFYATFDGPARGIRCALEVVERVRDLGIEVRAGLHTGECRVIDGKIGGVAVSIGARIAATASDSEVRVSQTVKDLVAGSGFVFDHEGEHELKGVPGRWHLYRVVRG
ncbi:MAG: adenylate/guanylate cyclase domain-containing protein [Actinomycetota bacterium]|nr:adenylate/guanylate cyclase domain-containing protein [Actinomycetota bacterium]